MLDPELVETGNTSLGEGRTPGVLRAALARPLFKTPLDTNNPASYQMMLNLPFWEEFLVKQLGHCLKPSDFRPGSGASCISGAS